MAGSGTWNSYTWNGATWNGGAGAALVVSFPVPIRRTCLSADFFWLMELEAEMGCAVPTEYDIPRSDAILPGTARRFSVSLSNLPTGRTLSQVKLFIKQNIEDDDADAIIEKTITAVQSASGHITDVGTDDDAAFYVDVSSTDSAIIPPNRTYHYFFKATCSDGVIDIPLRGRLPTARA